MKSQIGFQWKLDNMLHVFFAWSVNFLKWPKRYYKSRMFFKHANLVGGRGSGTIIGSSATCKNDTGKKENITIGRKCDIQGGIIASGTSTQITIGDFTTIRYNSVVGAAEKIDIGNHVIISNNVTIYDNNNHPIDPQMRIKMTESGFYSKLWSWEYSDKKPIVIKDNVWIGEHSVILKGVTIGEGAIIGCRSVVTKDVEPYTIVAGNPARVVKYLHKPEAVNENI